MFKAMRQWRQQRRRARALREAAERCAKCGISFYPFHPPTTAYQRDDKPNPPQEWLKKTCGRCGYSWKAAVADAPRPDA